MSNKADKITAIKGMNDLLPAEAHLWEIFENTAQSVLQSYGFQQIRTPIVEETRLFSRAIGAVTDIVEKEMYTFVDQLNGESLTLRPEGTASCVRAAIQHNLLYAGPQRLYYAARNHLRFAARNDLGLRSFFRTSSIIALNVAHAVRARGASLPLRLAAVARGTRDHFAGRYGRAS